MTIKKLPDDIIARISAGEVVTRPYNILKETIENSLDANSTHITIRISPDALSLGIEDDGSGISEEDFKLLCRPHCTSKLTSEADLFSLSSYGFRGEALSSISRCSKIKVRSKRIENEIGFEATYNDTQLVTIKGIGMKNGTLIEVKDIFYNNKVRERYFSKRRDEIREMIELIEAYAVFNHNVSFEVFIGEKLKELFGNVKRQSPGQSEDDMSVKTRMLDCVYKTNDELLYGNEETFSIIFTSPNFNLKKGIFIFFVNGRLVINQGMKESLLRIYRDILPPQTYPLVYLELRTNKSETDVNVHPCKKEVLFANEELITREICSFVESRLRTQNYKQKPMRILPRDDSHNPIKVYSDPTSQSITECLEVEEVVRKEFRLVSLERLKSEVIDVDTEFFRLLTYVGAKDSDTILVQHGSSLLNCKVRPLLKEYLYQSVLQGFGNFERKSLSIPVCEEVNEMLRGVLDEYFSIKIVENRIVTLPIVSTVCVEDPELWLTFRITTNSEYETLKEIATKIAELYSSAAMSLKLFNIVKRKIIGTESALRCFGLVVTLKELYKNFERC